MTDNELDSLRGIAHESGWKACSDYVAKGGAKPLESALLPKLLNDAMFSQMPSKGINPDPISDDNKNAYDTFVSAFLDGVFAYFEQAN